MAPGAGGSSGPSPADRRDGGPVSASGAAGARCAVFASQAISSNDTPEQERGRLARTRVAWPQMERISDPVSTCIRRGRGRREGDLISRPFGIQGAACLSEVNDADRRGHPGDLADYRSDSSGPARLLRLVVRKLRARRNDRGHDRGGPAQLRGCEPQALVPFAFPEQLSPGHPHPARSRPATPGLPSQTRSGSPDRPDPGGSYSEHVDELADSASLAGDPGELRPQLTKVIHLFMHSPSTDYR